MEDHARIEFRENKLFLVSDDPDGAFNCFVNGECLEDYEIETENDDGEIYFEKELEDMDRLIFGTCTTFLVRIPFEGKIKKNVLVDN